MGYEVEFDDPNPTPFIECEFPDGSKRKFDREKFCMTVFGFHDFTLFEPNYLPRLQRRSPRLVCRRCGMLKRVDVTVDKGQ